MTPSLSQKVHTSQAGTHPRLEECVVRHLESEWQHLPRTHTDRAFASTEQLLACPARELILDSGCGTGHSTRLIAAENPDSWVLGIDQSAARLATACSGDLPRREANIIWVRAELSGFWRLALEAGWRLQAHYLLYPNPWPKPGHLQRRWHAHPVFPTMLRLGGYLELRTNWKIYADEFAQAIEIACGADASSSPLRNGRISTAFERK